MKDETGSLMLGIVAVILWSTVATAFKITLRYMDPVTMVFIASLVSLFSISVFSFFSGGWKSIVNEERRAMMTSMALGLLNPFLYYLVLFGGYDHLDAQIAQSINYSWPVVFTVLSVLVLKQSIGKRSVMGIIMGFLGVLVVSTRGFSISGGIPDPMGLVLAALSALLWAGFWTLNLKSKGSVTSKLFFNFLGGAIPASLLVLLIGVDLPQPRGWGAATYVGIFEMGVTFLIWMKALSLSRNNAKTSMLIYLSPFISLVLIGSVLSERIIPSTVVGLLLIVVGLIVQRTGKARAIDRS